MKKIALITLLLAACVCALAQPQLQRRIYLWDVTLSMKAYQGRTPDIYDDVVNFLVKEIDGITDESTEIVVLPFQTCVLETWEATATPEGKKRLIKHITDYDNNVPTETNIAGPIQDVQKRFIRPDKYNVLILLTDGGQSDSFGGKASLLKLLERWGGYANENYAYCLYVMLTEKAKEEAGEEIINLAARPGDNLEIVDSPGQMELIDLRPEDLVYANLKDDKTANIPLIYRKSISFPDGVEVRVVAEDSVMNVNQTVVVKDGKVTFDLVYKQPYEELKVLLPEVTSLPIRVELANQDAVKDRSKKILYLTKDNLELRLINKPEKTLKISIIKK
ncbi:MAG: hypothetical protein LBN29_08085 [Mediterranea sp.]|jgi:hypothetical protein|nr:hypothetical protein [Mediterranea sp.]